jgi:hypothetical protein
MGCLGETYGCVMWRWIVIPANQALPVLDDRPAEAFLTSAETGLPT